DHALYAAAAAQVNEGKAVAHEIVAHVHDVRLGKKDDAVAVGGSAGKMQGADVLAVQVHGNIVIEGDDRQGFLGLRLGLHFHGAEIADRAAFFQALRSEEHTSEL